MKVLHLFNEINFSGAEKMYASAAYAFQKRGCEILAFSTGKNIGTYVVDFEKNGICVYHYPICNSFKWRAKSFLYYFKFY